MDDDELDNDEDQSKIFVTEKMSKAKVNQPSDINLLSSHHRFSLEYVLEELPEEDDESDDEVLDDDEDPSKIFVLLDLDTLHKKGQPTIGYQATEFSPLVLT